MPSNKIGGEQFIRITGGPFSPAGERTEEITRKRVNGIALRKIGKKGQPFSVSTVVDVLTTADADVKLLAYEDLMGTQVTVYDGTGTQFNNVAVRDVRIGFPKVLSNGVGGVAGGSILITATWTLQFTSFN